MDKVPEGTKQYSGNSVFSHAISLVTSKFLFACLFPGCYAHTCMEIAGWNNGLF